MTAEIPPRPRGVRASYDALAARYASEVAGELAGKPLDRALLAAFAELAGAVGPPGRPGRAGPDGARAGPDSGWVWDVGCGPGHVAAHLASLGVPVAGIDLSPAMVEQARARHPDLEFSTGSMTRLPGPGAAWAGIVCFYALIHLIDDADLRAALGEFRRVLLPGGLVLAAVHVGPPPDIIAVPASGGRVAHLDTWWDTPVDVSFRFFEPDWLAAEFRAAGFTVEAVTRRAPYAGVEVATERAYLLARADRAR
jgi:SAM-dependent methyltransferase